jgi:hypothetical protein
MEWTLNILVFGCACGVGGFVLACLCGLRGKVSDIVLSRAGFRVHTNSWAVMFEIMSHVNLIDSFTQKSMRKAMAGLMLLNLEESEMSTDVMLVNEKANQPLMYAIYENHHTRELDPDSVEDYIEEKVHDIFIAVRGLRKRFPELTDELIEEYLCRWIKKVVLPNLRRACNEKLKFYRSLLCQSNIIESLKEKIRELIKKNEGYIENIASLAERFGSSALSTTINPTS